MIPILCVIQYSAFYHRLFHPIFCLDFSGGFVKSSSLLAPKLNESALKDVIEQLKRTPVGLDNVLARVIPQGVAYHHAG